MSGSRHDTLSFILNGVPQSIEADPLMPLLWALRDVLRLKGTKYGCGIGECGLCMVLVDGEPNHACKVPVRRIRDRRVTTIEGLAREGHPLLEAWIERQVPQCGYCQPAQLIAAAALLRRVPEPDGREIAAAMDAVLCRCGTYQRIGQAIAAVASASRPEATTAAPSAPVGEAAGEGTLNDAIALNEWIAIRSDNRVVVMINHSEMGQGVLTALAMLIAEELEVDLNQVATAFAPADERYVNPLFGSQLTGGSSAIRGEWERLRRAGAEARERLVATAAKEWAAERRECRAEHGTVVHAVSGRRMSYAELAEGARDHAPPARLRLKEPSRFRLLGKTQPRLDIPGMVVGSTRYGCDVTVPEMLVALIRRCPIAGGGLESFDASEALQVPGVEEVVATEQGVAVLAESFWSAWQGRERLAVTWAEGQRSRLDTAAIYRGLERALQREGRVARRRGDAERELRRADRIITALYRTPYLAHCTPEPMNCIADVRETGCDLWVGTQNQTETQGTAAALTGLPRSKVRVHTTFLGGGFGRRLATDFVAEAVRLSMRFRRPVQVLWTRDDDLQHDRYRPAHAVLLQATLDAAGRPTAWWQRIAGPPSALNMNDVPYAIGSFREEHVELDSALPVGAWRGVGATQNAFAVESFIDELAHEAKRDPFEFRLALLEDARYANVLQAAADAAGWHGAAPEGHHRGIALYGSFGSRVAQVAEVSVDVSTNVRVHRVVCAIDCGQAVNPDGIRAQLEGSVALGLSAALKEEIRLESGRIAQTGFADYPVLTYTEMPTVGVHIVMSEEPPAGVGEPGVPPVAPAVANAVFAASGRRLRTLPLLPPRPPRTT